MIALRAVRWFAIVLLAVEVALVGPGFAATIADFRLVALSDAPLPGVAAGVVVEQFFSPHIDNGGNVEFFAELLSGVGGVNFTNDLGIWTEHAPGDLHLIARNNDLVLPPNYLFGSILTRDLPISGGGSRYFTASIIDSSNELNSNNGIFRYTAESGLELLAVARSIGVGSLPVVGETITNFYDYNELASVVFKTGSGFGPIWLLDAVHGLRHVATRGSFPSINDLGDVAYRRGERHSAQLVVWNRDAPSPRVVAMVGAPAPGTGDPVAGDPDATSASFAFDLGNSLADWSNLKIIREFE